MPFQAGVPHEAPDGPVTPAWRAGHLSYRHLAPFNPKAPKSAVVQ